MQTTKTFKTGTAVEFDFKGRTYQGQFVRKFTPARNAGQHFEVKVDGKVERVAVTSEAGKTMRKAQQVCGHCDGNHAHNACPAVKRLSY